MGDTVFSPLYLFHLLAIPVPCMPAYYEFILFASRSKRGSLFHLICAFSLASFNLSNLAQQVAELLKTDALENVRTEGVLGSARQRLHLRPLAPPGVDLGDPKVYLQSFLSRWTSRSFRMHVDTPASVSPRRKHGAGGFNKYVDA